MVNKKSEGQLSGLEETYVQNIKNNTYKPVPKLPNVFEMHHNDFKLYIIW